MTEILKANEKIALSLSNIEKLGMYYTWLGWALERRLMLKESYKYLIKAVKIGGDTGNQEILAHANTWLTWSCADLGLYDEATVFIRQALTAAKNFKSNVEVFRLGWCGFAYVYWMKGDSGRCFEAGKRLLDIAQKYSDNRSLLLLFRIVKTSLTLILISVI